MAKHALEGVRRVVVMLRDNGTPPLVARSAVVQMLEVSRCFAAYGEETEDEGFTVSELLDLFAAELGLERMTGNLPEIP